MAVQTLFRGADSSGPGHRVTSYRKGRREQPPPLRPRPRRGDDPPREGVVNVRGVAKARGVVRARRAWSRPGGAQGRRLGSLRCFSRSTGPGNGVRRATAPQQGQGGPQPSGRSPLGSA